MAGGLACLQPEIVRGLEEIVQGLEETVQGLAEIVQDQARVATMCSVTETKLAEITYQLRSWLVPRA